jgi:lipid A ethanolaminephosphotransferase
LGTRRLQAEDLNLARYRRFPLTPTRVILLTAIFLVLTGNSAFFSQLASVYPWDSNNFRFLLSAGVTFTCALALLMSLSSVLIPARIVATIFVLLAAAIGYFSDQFGTVVDTVMLQNMLETDQAEAGDLLTAGFFLHFMTLGVFPVIALWVLPLKRASRLHELRFKAQTAVGALVIAVICLFSFSDQYTSFFRQHKSLRYYTNPTYALYSAASLYANNNSGDPTIVTPLAIDARIPAEQEADYELIIMVVGETARRDRFSLNGYPRVTNPALTKEKNVISYTNISACGTSTKTSVPCMFSLLGRETYSSDSANGMENVLDVLRNVGVSVLWRDNNSSAKGVADRILYEDFKAPTVNSICDSECRDVGMLQGLQGFIDEQHGDILIVLHQMGNHGPAYFKRYPPEFEQFSPACHSEELSECSDAEISNAYDNAILYTDYFLSQVIALLKDNTPQFETAMLYVSDHGESLGERGLYLHGLPYSIAPPEQTDVPVIVWIGDSSDIDMLSALELKDASNSHDAVFHSLLALFEVESDLVSATAPLFDMIKVNSDEEQTVGSL